jgi:hypothetical protein
VAYPVDSDLSRLCFERIKCFYQSKMFVSPAG